MPRAIRFHGCLSVPLLAAASVLLVAPRAHAQGVDEFGAYGREARDQESPQDMAIELRFGRYVPDADDGLSGTPYADIFGDNNRYYGGFELDWQALRIPYLGTFGPGFGIGYTVSTARAPLTSGEGLSAQSTSLEILPMYAVAVLRADVLARETFIPIVPYAKLGVGLALWRANEADDTASADGVAGKGTSYGSHMALGAMFLLDVIQPDDARSADATLGLNHTYLFAEWSVSDLDGFGGSDQLQVGTDTWTVGITLEF